MHHHVCPHNCAPSCHVIGTCKVGEVGQLAYAESSSDAMLHLALQHMTLHIECIHIVTTAGCKHSTAQCAVLYAIPSTYTDN